VDVDKVFFGGLDSTLYALNIKTGKVEWKFKTKGQIRSTVAIDQTHLYLNGGDGKIYSLAKDTGKVEWVSSIGAEKKYDFADYHQSSPVLYNNRLYVGSGDGSVFAISVDKGRKIWSYQTGDVVHGTPVVTNNKVFVGSFDGYVYGLQSESGTLVWKFKTAGHKYFPKGEVQGSPTSSEGLVFIGARDYNVYALDQEKGFAHWNKVFSKGWVLANSVHDSVLYMAGADERILIAADPVSGAEHYRRKMEFLIFGLSAYSESMVYTGTTIGKLHGINAKTGEKVWTITTDGYEKHHLNYFKADDTYRDDIYSIIKSNEHFLEVEYELGGIFSTPAIQHDLIIITTTEGTVYCYRS
jgi:eukaryotic-like serine/threonine-protein kinase